MAQYWLDYIVLANLWWNIGLFCIALVNLHCTYPLWDRLALRLSPMNGSSEFRYARISVLAAETFISRSVNVSFTDVRYAAPPLCIWARIFWLLLHLLHSPSGVNNSSRKWRRHDGQMRREMHSLQIVMPVGVLALQLTAKTIFFNVKVTYN